MKMEHFMIVFSILLVATILACTYPAKVATTGTEFDQDTRQYLDAAVRGAMETAIATKTDDVNSESSFWNTDLIISTEQVLVDTFAANFGYAEGTENGDISNRLPVIAYIDYDGIRFSYIQDGQRKYDEPVSWIEQVDITQENGLVTDDSEKENLYDIQYSLDETLTVTKVKATDDDKENSFTGTYEEVYKYLGEPAFMTGTTTHLDKSKITEMKNTFILSYIQEQLGYYINNLDITAREEGKHYELNLDFGSDFLSKNISQPAIIAFFQGPVFPNTDTKMIIHGICCYEMDTYDYPVTIDNSTGELLYHSQSCSSISEDSIMFYMSSKADAADLGASPHSCMD